MKMKNTARRTLCLLLVLAMTLTMSVTTLAASTVYAKDTDGNEYTSIDAAWSAAESGKTIIMTSDWMLSSRLVLDEDKTATIYMNGHRIARTITSVSFNGEVICLDDNSTLNLYGKDESGEDVTTTLSYQGYKPDSDSRVNLSSQSGGLINGGWSKDGGGGIHMKEKATLLLDHVVVAGNRSNANEGAGVEMRYNDSTLTMQNGAEIAYNYTDSKGGGIAVLDDSCKIFMNNASIHDNYAGSDGGGLSVEATKTYVEMNNGSSIHNNSAYGGGAVYFDGLNFRLGSVDGTGSLSDNTARSTHGGGIYVAYTKASAGSCRFYNLNITGNWTDNDGGGIYADMYNVDVQECRIKNNTADVDGGGIYVDDEWCIITGCDIIGNKANDEGGGIYNNDDKTTIDSCTITGNQSVNAGGGVFSSSYNDLILECINTIKDNTRTDNSKDDLYLNDSWLSTSYLTCAADKESEIGIRTDATGERKIGINAEYDVAAYFSDVDGYYLEYRAADKEMYLVKGQSYKLTVNGKSYGAYKSGTTVTVNAASLTKYGTVDESKVFINWNDAGDVQVADANSAQTTITMPSHDVELTANYFKRIWSATLTVAAPKAGEAFPSEAVFSWTDESGESHSLTVEPYWLEVLGEDNTQTVSGTAQYGTTYAVGAKIPKDDSTRRIFTSWVNITVVYDGTAMQGGLAQRDGQGSLCITGPSIEMEKAEATTVETPLTIRVQEGTTEAALVALMPSTVAVIGTDGKSYLVDLENTDCAEVLENGAAAQTGDVTATVSSDSVAISEETKAVIRVEVSDSAVTAAPTASKKTGTYQGSNLDVDLSCVAEGSTIYYTLDGGDTQTYSGTITLNCAAGAKETHVLKAWAESEEGGKSSEVLCTYVLDNPYKVTISGKDTGLLSKTLWETPKTFYYYAGDRVVVAALAEDDEVFEKWESVPEGATGEVTDNDLVVESISDDMNFTAIYNPVVKAFDVTLDAPKAGAALATKVTKATTTVTNVNDVTAYLGDIEWSTEDTTAAYGTVYTATLKLAVSGSMKYCVSDQLEVTVNGGEDENIEAYVAEVEDGYTLTILFPATEKGKLASVQQPEKATVSRSAITEGKWDLPAETTVTLADESTLTVPISWTTLPQFDETELGTQTLTAAGNVVLPDEVDAGEVSTAVSMTISVGAAAQAETPVASVESGTYTQYVQVKLRSATKNASIYYTLDGTVPTTASTLYDDTAILIKNDNSPVTLKAIAVRKDLEPSEAAVYTYEIQDGQVTLNVTGSTEAMLETETLSYVVSAADADQLASATLTFAVSGLENVKAEELGGWKILVQTWENGVLKVLVFNKEGASGQTDMVQITGSTTGVTGDVSVKLTAAKLSVYEGESEDYITPVLDNAEAVTKIRFSTFDVNRDGVVDLLDITRAQRCFGLSEGSQGWNPLADVDGSGNVDISDLILILNNYTVAE